MKPPENWVFLGDSLTEGVGSSRVNWVSQLAQLMRDGEARKPEFDRYAIHEFRFRRVDPASFNPFIQVNHAGLWRRDSGGSAGSIWMWNLACEGTTVDTDVEWLPWIENLHPTRVFVHRGSLESILRPQAFVQEAWPWWVPRSWRGLAAMDPRCYFSSTWWRRLKQVAENRLKQLVRHHLLKMGQPAPVSASEVVGEQVRRLLLGLVRVSGDVSIVGLLPVGSKTFPGSAEQFEIVNRSLADIARELGVRFLNPSDGNDRFRDPTLFHLDQFHLNDRGARELALFIAESLDLSLT